MSEVQQSAVIRYRNQNKHEDSLVAVSIDRAYQPPPDRGRMPLRTGPWQVEVNFGVFADPSIPVDAARMLAAEITTAAEEAHRRNATPIPANEPEEATPAV